MSATVPPPSHRWPLRPDAPRPQRDWAREFLELRRTRTQGTVTGLSVALANWLGLDVLLVRCLFVMTGLCSGIGVVAYFAGWLLTRNSASDEAPLDHLGHGWRTLQPRVVASWTLAFGLMACLVLSSIAGFGWLPIAVIAATIWAGRRQRMKNINSQQQAVRYWAPAPQSRTDKATVVTVITLTVAAAAALGATVLDQGNVILPLAAALGVIGFGLMIVARFGTGKALIVPGIIIATLLTVGLTVTAARGPDAIPYAAPSELTNVTYYRQQDATDLSSMAITENQMWYIDLDDSQFALTIPDDQNVIVEVSYASSVIALPDDLYTGSGQASYQQIVDEDRPTLTITIDARDSQLWVDS